MKIAFDVDVIKDLGITPHGPSGSGVGLQVH